MPILEIEIVTRPGETLPDSLATDLARAAGKVFGTPAGRTWVRLRELPAARYGEDGADGDDVYPVFVAVVKAKTLPPDQLRQEAGSLASAIAVLCGRPADNVHLIYEPAALGRIAFGGLLYEEA